MKNFFRPYDKKAFTFIEVLIATVLFMALIMATGMICIQGVRALQKGRNRVATQTEALIAIDRLCRELNETHTETITIIYSVENDVSGDDDFDAICFGTAKSDSQASDPNTNVINTGNGKFDWEQYIIYSKAVGSGDVYRTVMKLPSPKDPDPAPYDIDTIKFCLQDILGPAVKTDHRKMARDIYNLAFTERNVTPVVYGVNIKVVARIEIGDDDAGNPVYETTELNTFIRPWK